MNTCRSERYRLESDRLKPGYHGAEIEREEVPPLGSVLHFFLPIEADTEHQALGGRP